MANLCMTNWKISELFYEVIYSGVFREGAICHAPSALKICTILLSKTLKFMCQLRKKLQLVGDVPLGPPFFKF